MHTVSHNHIDLTWSYLLSVPYPLQLDVADIITIIKGTPTNSKHDIFLQKYHNLFLYRMYTQKKQFRILPEQNIDVSILKKAQKQTLYYLCD